MHIYVFRKCLVIFPVNPESNEELIAKMKSFEMELVEMEETTLSEEQVWFGLQYVLNHANYRFKCW